MDYTSSGKKSTPHLWDVRCWQAPPKTGSRMCPGGKSSPGWVLKKEGKAPMPKGTRFFILTFPSAGGQPRQVQIKSKGGGGWGYVSCNGQARCRCHVCGKVWVFATILGGKKIQVCRSTKGGKLGEATREFPSRLVEKTSWRSLQGVSAMK